MPSLGTCQDEKVDRKTIGKAIDQSGNGSMEVSRSES